ncbi:diguanylate cyclase [Candidatus Sumerlaeota bacterium]|nr:diguanylate cyclase [Candidatus Sumerlaeota bacterium]
MEKLSLEGFSCVPLSPDEDLPSQLRTAHAAVILLSTGFDHPVLISLTQWLKENLPNTPIVHVVGRSDEETVSAPPLPQADGLCYLDMSPTHLAVVLRGVIRSAFTIQELVHANRTLNEISITDSLTGLHNRGYMMDRLNLEFKRAERSGEPLSCLMIDIDHFKNINDTYGHKFGDVILRAVAVRLKHHIRETDILGRYGGEEFLIVLPSTDFDGAEFLAEKLRNGMEQEEFRHDNVSLLVTASFGVASTENREVIAADHLLQLSDRALYQAKESGRNRVCIAGRTKQKRRSKSESSRQSNGEMRLTRVAIVCTDSSPRRFVDALKSNSKYQVFSYDSARDFLTAFKLEVPEMIVIQQGDPAREAFDLCRRIKKQLNELFIPLAIVLGNADDESREQAIQAGADDVFLPDPDPRDFLSRLRTMAHLKRLHDQWRQTHQDLTVTRTRLIRAERLNALGEMAAGIAHDFNNMLAPILGRTQLLKEKCDNSDTLRSLEVIEKAATDGAATIRRIQDFARSATSRNYEVLDVAELVQDCIQITRGRWKDEAEREGRRYVMEVEFRGTLVVYGSSTELREVVTSIIMNCLDAMPDGGTVRFEGQIEEDEVVLLISDTGCGMSEDVLNRVFEPFFSTKRGEGTGLGLSVAYGIVMRHQGRIECSSTPGQGTLLRIRLPLHAGRPSVPILAQAGAPTVPVAADKKRVLDVLVVDDEAPVREVIRDMLEQDDHKVFATESGREALRRIEEHEYDMLITDLSMPEMSGWEVARQARKLRPDLTIILTSGWGRDFSRQQIVKHGVNFLMPKPVPFTTLKRLTRLVAQGQVVTPDP